MQLHQLQPENKKKKRKRVGRGGKKGTYSGRGIKGQKARPGHKLQPIIRELIKKYPKLRGYKFKPIKEKPVIVNLSVIDKYFQEGEEITPQSLIEKGIIERIRGRIPQIKILGNGEISKAVVVQGCQLSKNAQEKIKKAKGKIKEK